MSNIYLIALGAIIDKILYEISLKFLNPKNKIELLEQTRKLKIIKFSTLLFFILFINLLRYFKQFDHSGDLSFGDDEAALEYHPIRHFFIYYQSIMYIVSLIVTFITFVIIDILTFRIFKKIKFNRNFIVYNLIGKSIFYLSLLIGTYQFLIIYWFWVL